MTAFAHLERVERFMGAGADFESARAVLFGVPMDFTTSFRPGARFGPQRVRAASYGLEEFSFSRRRDVADVAFVDMGDVAVVPGNVALSLERTQATAAAILAAGKIPVAIGGEHLISLPLIEAAHARFPDLAVLQFDAHADLRADYLGERLSHATVMRRVAERIGGQNVYQFGIRSGDRVESEYAAAHTRLYTDDVLAPLTECLPELRGRPVYITVDIDVLDPAYAPGTGTPEPGGITSRELIRAIDAVSELNTVGFDLVEVAPGLDPTERTPVVAAKLILQALLGL